jgi:GNAT superfamily N-acetyltransferase
MRPLDGNGARAPLRHAVGSLTEVRDMRRHVRSFNRAAASLLAPLREEQRVRLVDAMGVVERRLTAGLVSVALEDPAGAAGRSCLASYFGELDARFDGGFDPRRAIPAGAAQLTEPAGLFLIARLRDEPIGCGGAKLHGDWAEVKRMWVAPSARGLGVGRRLLDEIERHARERGVRVARLETNRRLREAAALYRSAGYREIAPYNAEPYAHHWFEKRLGA